MNNYYDQILKQQYAPKENAYGIGAMGIASALPGLYNPYASTGSNLGITLGSSLLAGLLGGMSNRRASAQNAELLTQAMSLNDPSKRDALMQSDPRLKAIGLGLMQDQEERKQKLLLKNQERAMALEDYGAKKVIDQIMQKIEWGELTPEEGKQAIAGLSSQFRPESTALEPRTPTHTLGGIPGKESTPEQVSQFSAPEIEQGQELTKALSGQIEGVGPVADPQEYVELLGLGPSPVRNILKPQDKALIDAESDVQKSIEGQTKDFADLQVNWETMKNTYAFNDIASTKLFIQSFAKILDPGSVVRGEEIKNAQSTQSLLEELGYSWKSLVTGKSQLSETAKQRIMRAAAEKHNAYANRISNYVYNQRGVVRSFGGHPGNVFSPAPTTAFNFNKWAETAPKQITLEEQVGKQDRLAEIDARIKELEDLAGGSLR